MRSVFRLRVTWAVVGCGLAAALAGTSRAGDERSAVPDPIVDLRQTAYKRWEVLAKAADKDGDEALSQSEWPAEKLAAEVPELAGITFAACDRDRDGRVDRSEAEWLFDIAYGLVRPDGRPLRTPRGTVLDWSYVRKMDRNRDGYLSRDEFVKGYHPGPKKSAEIFVQRDLNHDGRLSDEEMAAFLSWNIAAMFRGRDKDKDGLVSDAELTNSVGNWAKNVAERTVAAFDDNGDGKLSLAEYGVSTFGSPVTTLAQGRKDADNDGKLSFDEFYGEKPPLLLALHRHFFRHFDRDTDGFLSLREFPFNIDYNKVNPEIALAARDLDGDGKLIFPEVFTEKKPVKPDARALDRYEMRLARAESRFRTDDRDASGYLDLDELIASRESVMDAARRHSQVLSNRKTMLEGNYWVRKGVLVVNEIAFLAIVWMVVRSARKPRVGRG